MKRLKIGDVFEIETSKGKGYFQYVFNNKTIGELIRVFPNLFKNTSNDFESIVKSEDFYFIHFPLRAACRQGIVNLINNFNIPPSVELPTKMCSKQVNKEGQLISWHIVDYNTWQIKKVKELSEKEKKLSPWGTWNDTLLIERLEPEWSPENGI